MPITDPGSPESVYATRGGAKGNIAFPGTQAQATAAEALATARLNDEHSPITHVTTGTIKVAT